MKKKIKGKVGEELVARKLKEKKFRIMAMNLRLKGLAEIDVLACNESRIWLVEVKTHESPSFGSLIKESQIERLQRAREVLSKNYPCSYEVELILAWVKLSQQKVEFFEIP